MVQENNFGAQMWEDLLSPVIRPARLSVAR